ncbi:MAG: MotA/TolQ/ExbB proton channel family protein [Bacillota bacterium]
MAVLSSQYLERVLHSFSESLLFPVILGLVAFLIWVLVELGVLLAEYRQRRKDAQKFNSRQLLREIAGGKAQAAGAKLAQRIAVGNWPETVKGIVTAWETASQAAPGMCQVFARRLWEAEEQKRGRALERVEMLAKLGPILGLMGTLIPLGPGLAALGNGDVAALAQAVVIAFDTTVSGLAVGGAAFVIAKVRRRWQTVFLADLEIVLEALVEEATAHVA